MSTCLSVCLSVIRHGVKMAEHIVEIILLYMMVPSFQSLVTLIEAINCRLGVVNNLYAVSLEMVRENDMVTIMDD